MPDHHIPNSEGKTNEKKKRKTMIDPKSIKIIDNSTNGVPMFHFLHKDT